MEGPSAGGGNALFCRKCGGRLLPDALFCVRCGERVKLAAQPEQPAQPAFPLQSEQPPAQPAPPVQAAAPMPSALAGAKREKPQPAPRKPMKPWLVVLLSAAGSFAVLGTATVIVFVSATR